jgi:hypothetical protein
MAAIERPACSAPSNHTLAEIETGELATNSENKKDPFGPAQNLVQGAGF